MKSQRLICMLAPALLAGICFATEDTYKLREAEEYKKERGGTDAPNIRTSEHFAIKWGNTAPPNFTITEKFLQDALAYFEKVRAVYIDKVHFPMTKSNGKQKFKNNIYITQTGLKPFLEGYAFGFADAEGYGVFIGEPSIMTPGHGASSHELGHSMQAETGGFRDSDYVGWFWECHAQFMAHQAVPENVPNAMDVYLDTSHYDLNSTRHHYGSWIFLQYLSEKAGFGYPFINSLWFKPSVNIDEDATSKMMRLAGLDHKGWADLFGDYAKRNVTFNSYKLGASYASSIERMPLKRKTRLYTPVEPAPGMPGWVRVPYAVAPQQHAYNVIPLAPTGTKVKVEFKGIIDADRKSEWRNTIVVVNDAGKERFSKTWNQGAGSVELKADEHKVYFVSAATPGVYKHIKFLERELDQERFPYLLKVEGATPYLPATATKQDGAQHANGGGFVASTAKVAATAYVGPNAQVLGKATVDGNARIEDYAVVSGDAKVLGDAIVAGHAVVSDRATVSENARVSGYATVWDEAKIGGNARVTDFARIVSRATIAGNAVVADAAAVWGTNIGGNTLMLGGADPGPGLKDCTKGIYTIFVNQEDIDKAKDNHGLYASYDFSSLNNALLKDKVTRADGFLVGNPTWGKGYLEFNGKSGVELPTRVADLRSVAYTFDLVAESTGKEQALLTIDGTKGSKLVIYADNGAGAPGIWIEVGGISKKVAASRSLVKGVTAKLEVTFDGKGVSMSVDGNAALEINDIIFAPEDLRPQRVQLGTGFKGRIAGFTVVRGTKN